MNVKTKGRGAKRRRYIESPLLLLGVLVWAGGAQSAEFGGFGGTFDSLRVYSFDVKGRGAAAPATDIRRVAPAANEFNTNAFIAGGRRSMLFRDAESKDGENGAASVDSSTCTPECAKSDEASAPASPWSFDILVPVLFSTNPSRAINGSEDSVQALPSWTLNYEKRTANWHLKGIGQFLYAVASEQVIPNLSLPKFRLEVNRGDETARISPKLGYTVTAATLGVLGTHLVTNNDFFVGVTREFDFGGDKSRNVLPSTITFDVGYERRESSIAADSRHQPKIDVIAMKWLDDKSGVRFTQTFAGQFYSSRVALNAVATRTGARRDFQSATSLAYLYFPDGPFKPLMIGFSVSFLKNTSSLNKFGYSIVDVGPVLQLKW